jgi:transcriptional regulator with XRE-family HTH domain
MELCRRSGISIDSLRNWEQDRVLPRLDAVVKLAHALGVSLDTLAEGMEVTSSGQADEQAGPSKSSKRATGRAGDKARSKKK